MDMAAGVTAKIPEFIDKLFDIKTLDTFRSSLPTGELTVRLITGASEAPRELVLTELFPFMTLQDIKLALYLHFQKAAWAAPECIYLALHGPEEGKTYIGRQVAPVDFTWNLPTVSKSSPFLSPNPFTQAKAPAVDSRFVDSTGDRKIVGLVQRERLTLEDAFLKTGVTRGGTYRVLYAYLYKDVEKAIGGPRPMSERDWNGRLYPYFPFLQTGAEGATAAQISRANRLATIFQRRRQLLVQLENILANRGGTATTPLVNLTFAAVKRLQLTWPEAKNIPGIEAQFYEAPVTELRPFMRLIPVEGTGISKVYFKDGKTPDIPDPKLLVQWSQERSPSPERDYAFAKLLLRKGTVNISPLYSTLRLFDDGSADVIVEPPRGIKKLDPRSDLENLGTALEKGVEAFPFLHRVPDIGSADVVLGLRLRKTGDEAITPRALRERLPIFSAFFQEIPALTGESPLVMLRYKLVSNFAREDRIQAFITQVMNRKLAKGEALLANLTELVADEFQLDIEEARRKVAQKLQNQGEVALVVPETRDYRRQYVSGIDIAVFAQHPFYTFHLYNVNSLENLERVATALSILMSASTEELRVSTRAVEELERSETAEAAAGAVAPGAEEAEEGAEAEQDGFESPEQNENGFESPEEEVSASAAPPPEAADAADDLPDYLDFFSFNAAENSSTAVKKEGAPFSETSDSRPTAAGAAAGAPATMTPAALRKEIAAASAAEAPKKMLEAIPETDREEDVDRAAAATEKLTIANYFITKLHEADRRLFDYTKGHPSLKRYVSQCMPTYGRQPAVLSEEKFEEMQKEYADDVVFQVYPLLPDDPKEPTGELEKEYFTVLRYGTSKKQNYYLCSRYFCIRDEMLVREVDLLSNCMRRPRPVKQADGTLKCARKEPGECPFCRGKVIQNKKAPGPGETILERPVDLSKKRHLSVGFMKKTPHPEGFYLPCCFKEDEPIFYRDSRAFDKLKELGMPPPPRRARETGPVAAAVLAEEAGAGAAAVAGPAAGVHPLMDYYSTLAGVTTKYIVGAEKLPLEISELREKPQAAVAATAAPPAPSKGEAQIGLLPAALDEYFQQDQNTLVSRVYNPQKVKPGGMGFLRVAAENRLRYQNDALLSALAPFFQLNSAGQMKAHLLERIPPKVFVQLNYGNLLLEFYDPAELMTRFKTRVELVTKAGQWSANELGLDLQRENEEAIVRAYLSYTAFEAWLKSTETKKEFRQFALAMAQTGLLRTGARNGITFIVLDITKAGKLEVRCPPYGFNAELMAKNDIAFLMHHWSGVWEPIFYVDNRSPEERGAEVFKLVFQAAVSETWPAVVKRRFQEFMMQCNAPGRAVYTAQATGARARVPLNLALIPASSIKRLLAKDARLSLHGTVRDSYNHLAAVILRVKGREEDTMLPGLFPLPVADDGELFYDKQLYMDWDDPEYEPVPIDKLILFYKRFIEPRFQLYPGYSPIRIVESSRDGGIVAVQLRNGLFLPASPASSEEAAAALRGSPVISVKEMEWTINKDIVLKEDSAPMPGEEARLEAAEFQEVFEHLRLTFANWMAVKELGGKFRETVESTIFNHALPLFEKRKRLEILLAPEVGKWITTDFASEDAAATAAAATASLLRADCRIRGQSICSGRCVWKSATAEEKERCLLHVPEDVAMGTEPGGEAERRVSAPRALLYRLIEELLRYGERRRQLLEQDVSGLAAFENPVRLDGVDGVGKQTIYPEKSAAWFELLRMEWGGRKEEQPMFLEEMVRTKEEAAAAAEVAGAPPIPAAAPTAADQLSPVLQRLLSGGEDDSSIDPKVAHIKLSRAPLRSLIELLGLTAEELSVTADTTALTEDMLRAMTRRANRSIVQIDLRPSVPTFSAKTIRGQILFPTIPVFVIDSSGPGMLMKDTETMTLLAEEDMPNGLLQIVRSAKGVFAEKPAAAAQPAPAAAAGPVGKTIAERRAALQAAKAAAAAAAAAALEQAT